MSLAFDKAEMTSAQALPQPLLYPALQVDSESSQAACQALGLSQQRPTLAICPGAEFGPAKRWPHYHYAAAVSQLIEKGWQVWIFGSGKDQPVGDEIIAALPSNTASTALIWLEKPS